MGHKVFVSYKYADSSVQALSRKGEEKTTARDYVDDLQSLLTEEDHINKGEKDGEDLSDFKDSTIASKLRDKIYDSTVTIVLISPCMKDPVLKEADQWIPWEISYSLRETTRNDKTSHRNGMLAIVLPDAFGNYDYALEDKTCCQSGCRMWHTDTLFKILSKNMFNKKDKDESSCSSGYTVYHGPISYIHMIRWSEFLLMPSFYIEKAEERKDHADEYSITVNLN